MKEFFHKIKGLYLKLKIKQVSYERASIRPSHDWHILLVSATCLLFIFAGISLYFYKQIDSGNFFTVEDESIEKQVKIDDILLKKTIDEISDRETNRSNIRQNKNIPPDPSI